MTQAQAITILKTGANVFLTGEPGSGKTHTVREYVSYLKSFGIDPAITASTGIAATHIHGQTIHSWSGIGIREYLSAYDIDIIASKEHVAKRIRNAKVLIIDEISMLSAGTLDMVDAVCKSVRQQSAPFGGLQVILVGDFFQLPPVSRADNEAGFAYQSRSWQSLDLIVCYLTEQHRQEDRAYLSLLCALRANTIDETHHTQLQSRLITDKEIPTDSTKLFTKNIAVDAFNDEALARILGSSHVYEMETKGGRVLVESLKKGCLSPERLVLKKGAIVMCTKNNTGLGVVNGTLGAVIDFDRESGYPIIRTYDGERITITPVDWVIEEEGKIKASITQVPLRLAWAITVHKSQGMSMDSAVIDLRDVFTYGQGYVALSRVRTLSGLHLYGYNEQALQVHPEILRVDASFRESTAKAERAFGALGQNDIETMHTNFISAIGGSKQLAKKKSEPKKGTLDETKELFYQGKTISAIAKAQALTIGTIIDHLEQLVESGLIRKDDVWNSCSSELKKAIPHIHMSFEKLGVETLSPIHAHLKGKYSYDDLKIARMLL